jgi:hypothetical protein
MVELEKPLKCWNNLYWKVEFHNLNSGWVSFGIASLKNIYRD